MFRRFANLLRSYNGRVKVGVDKYGNTYYRRPEKVEGALVEKRWVEFKSEPDPNIVPVEWTSWLSGTRKEAPTAKEIANLEAHRQNVKALAAIYEKEEAVKSLRAKLSQEGVKADDLSLNDMEVMMRQISGNVSGQGGDLSQNKYTKLRANKDSTEPSAWQPNRNRTSNESPEKPTAFQESSATKPSEPQGQGDNFEPGTWRP